MKEKNYTVKDRIKSFLYLLFLLIIIWLLITSTFHYQELLTGISVSIILALFLNWSYLKLGFPPLSLKRIAYFIAYLVILFIEIVKANFDVAYRIIHPKMPIKPGIVVIKTSLKQDMAKLMLANSITLTPGTFTLDILGDNLLIHWINVRAESTDKATRIIGMRFEKYLKVIFD